MKICIRRTNKQIGTERRDSLQRQNQQWAINITQKRSIYNDVIKNASFPKRLSTKQHEFHTKYTISKRKNNTNSINNTQTTPPPKAAPKTTTTTTSQSTIITSTDPKDDFFAFFDESIEESEFIDKTAKRLETYGFNRVNTIPCVAVCRDELCQPLLNKIDKTWRSEKNTGGVHFLMSSLGGMVFLGTTGMSAALSHAPIDENGVERFAFYAFPHIGITKNKVGATIRPGHNIETDVCGALKKLQSELHNGYINLENDWDDIEQSLLKQRVISNLNLNKKMPSLAGLTYLVHQIILKDLTHLIDHCIDIHLYEGRQMDYSVITGVQIHLPNNQNFIWPGEAFCMVDNVRHQLSPWDQSSIFSPSTLRLNRKNISSYFPPPPSSSSSTSSSAASSSSPSPSSSPPTYSASSSSSHLRNYGINLRKMNNNKHSHNHDFDELL